MKRDMGIVKGVRAIGQIQKTNPHITMLRASTSFTLGHYTFSELVECGRRWAVRLSAWVYGERPLGGIPRPFPLPAIFTSTTPRIPRRQVWRTLGGPAEREIESESECAEDDDGDTDRTHTSGEED